MDNEPTQVPGSRSERLEQEKQIRRVRKGGPRGPRPTNRLRNIILAIVGIAVLGTGVAFGVAFNNTKNAVDKTFKSTGMTKARNVSSVLSSGKPFSVLLLGTDTGELGRDYKGRTDSIMIVTVNPKKEETMVMSIPRDTLTAPVGYEDEFPQKMNSAYEFGSAETTIKTLQDWLNVPIDFYALVNMNGLEKVVDEIGGVKVASPLTFNYNPDTAQEDAGNLYSFTEGSTTFTHAGEDGVAHTYHKMDGKAALAFSRMRYQDPTGDYGRQQRQRLVLEAIMAKAKANPTKLVNSSFLDTISDSAQTDLTFDDMLTIASKYLKAGNKITTDHAQGTSMALTSGSTEVVERAEQQRVTNVLRSALGLEAKKTGNPYGGEVSDATLAANGVPTSYTIAQQDAAIAASEEAGSSADDTTSAAQ